MTHERSLGGIEHREQRFGEPAGRPVDIAGGLCRRTLAEVLEVGLQPHRRVLELVALGDHSGDVDVGKEFGGVVGNAGELVVVDIGDVAVTETGGLRTLGGVGVGAGVYTGDLPRVVVDLRTALVLRGDAGGGLVAHDSSSTISASTMSSSFTVPAPLSWPLADEPVAFVSRAAAS